MAATSLRILGVSLPVPDFATAEKFYRWVLAMRDADQGREGVVRLGWGSEDRIELIDSAAEDAEESVTLRLPKRTAQETADWFAGSGIAPVAAVVPESQLAFAKETWHGAVIEIGPNDDRLVLTLRGRVKPRIDLHIPLSDRTTSPPAMNADVAGLEVPGLLGITTGAPDARAARELLGRLGIEPLDSSTEHGPLRVGDQQWIVEERDPPGLYGIAVVVELDRVKDLVRTLERLGVEHRHERNRIIALDPAGRVLLVHGLKGG